MTSLFCKKGGCIIGMQHTYALYVLDQTHLKCNMLSLTFLSNEVRKVVACVCTCLVFVCLYSCVCTGMC